MSDAQYLELTFVGQYLILIILFSITFTFGLLFLLSHPSPVKQLPLALHTAVVVASFVEIVGNTFVLVKGFTTDAFLAFNICEDIATVVGYVCLHVLTSILMENASIAVNMNFTSGVIARRLVIWLPSSLVVTGMLIQYIGFAHTNYNLWPGIWLSFLAVDAIVWMIITWYYYIVLHRISAQVQPKMRDRAATHGNQSVHTSKVGSHGDEAHIEVSTAGDSIRSSAGKQSSGVRVTTKPPKNATDKLKPFRIFLVTITFFFIIIISYHVYSALAYFDEAYDPYFQESTGEYAFFTFFILILASYVAYWFRAPINLSRVIRV